MSVDWGCGVTKVNGREERMNTALAVAYQREGRTAVETNTPVTIAEVLEPAAPGMEADREELFEQARDALRDKFGASGEALLARLMYTHTAIEAAAIRCETAVRMLHFQFQDGPHPGCTTRLVYLMAQRLAPELVLNMNGAELADMLGETRAAWSARNKRIYTGYLKARGAKAAKGRMQKSDTADAKYASAARGNTNRRGKFKKAA
jgi:hypothetical protein